MRDKKKTLYIYKTQNKIWEIGYTQRYLIKKFKDKEHQTLYYITWKTYL